MPLARLGLALVLPLAVLVACRSPGSPAADAARPTIYKWVDENGIAHYTTDRARIPDRVRDRVPLPEPAQAQSEAGVVAAPTPPAEAPAAAELPAPAETSAAPERRPEAPRAASRAAAGRTPLDESEISARVRAREDLDQRIASLEASIAADEEALKTRLGVPLDAGVALADDPEARAIAERLPQLLATLRALRDERGTLEDR